MNKRARKGVAPVRLNVLVPLVLGTLAGACFLVSAVVLASITQARGPIEEHLPRIGTLMLLSFGGILVLFSAAWAIFHLWIARPIQILTGEAETLALTGQNRGLLMPSRHALEQLPRAVEQLAQKFAAARAGTAEAIAGATQRAEEQKSWLEAILLDLTEGIVVCNLEHRILLYNQAAARILNMRDALGLGRSLFGLLTGEPILQMLELLQHGQGAGKTRRASARKRAAELPLRLRDCRRRNPPRDPLEPRAAAVRSDIRLCSIIRRHRSADRESGVARRHSARDNGGMASPAGESQSCRRNSVHQS
jgi:PAS domain-containing protein